MDITIEDLVKAGKIEVRNNSNLMTAYIRIFEEKFGRKPDCAGCTFNSDWDRLTINQNIISKNNIIMSTEKQTFILRDNSIIYSYDQEFIETNQVRRVRRYGNLMDEEFAENYLTFGTDEQIEIRKRQFKVLPEKFREEKTEQQLNDEELIIDTTDYKKLNELTKLAIKRGYPAEEYLDIDNDSDMSAYLETKHIEEVEADKAAEEEEIMMRIEREKKKEEEARSAKEEAERKAKEEADKAAKEKADDEAAKAKNEKKK